MQESECHLLMKSSETPRSKVEHLTKQVASVNEEIALMKIFTVQNASEQRNLGTTHTILHENEKPQAKKAALMLG